MDETNLTVDSKTTVEPAIPVDPLQKMFYDLNKRLSDISCSIANSEANINENIRESIAISEQKVIEHIDIKYNELSEKIVQLDDQITSLKNDSAQQSLKISELERESAAKSSYISTLEMKINKCNIILFNFEEIEITPEELVTNLVKFFNDVMKVIMKHSDIDVVYRLGKAQPRKTRPVFVSLTTLKMRDYIFSCRSNLKGSKVSISEDCPKNIIEERKKLLPALLGAKKLKKKAFFKYGTLMVNGVACSNEDIEKYCKAYAESSKRPRQYEASSPTNIAQDVKKPKSLSVVRSSSRPRSLSASNPPTPSSLKPITPTAHSSKQITQFFNSAVTNSPNSKTIFLQSEQ